MYMKKVLRKVLLILAILVGLYLLGTWEQGHKEQKKAREAPIVRSAADWFERMANDQAAEALDLCGFPFDANGVEHAATRTELEPILPRYLDTQAGAWPWTMASLTISQFHHIIVAPDQSEKRSLAKGTRVVLLWIGSRQNEVRVYVRPDPEPKVVGFKVSGLDKE